MRISFRELSVPLKKPFTISRGTIFVQPVLIVELTHNGVTGLGEATANDYYGHSLATIRASVERVRPVVEAINPTQGEEVYLAVRDALADDTFALSALDIAANDLVGKTRGVRCHEMWGLRWPDNACSSLTLGIDTPAAMVSQLLANPGWDAYKIKLGTPRDLEIMAAIRDNTDAALRVDANCAWSADEAIAHSHRLRDLGVEFLEQPLPPDASEADMARVFAESALPVVADESCQTPRDVAVCSNFFHGVNVKLCKCGGLTPAFQMLQEARACGMLTMVGCMVETSIGISAGAQLLPLLDYADLDGAILLGRDPAVGCTLRRGRVELSQTSGCGAQLTEVGAFSACEMSPS